MSFFGNIFKAKKENFENKKSKNKEPKSDFVNHISSSELKSIMKHEMVINRKISNEFDKKNMKEESKKAEENTPLISFSIVIFIIIFLLILSSILLIRNIRKKKFEKHFEAIDKIGLNSYAKKSKNDYKNG